MEKESGWGGREGRLMGQGGEGHSCGCRMHYAETLKETDIGLNHQAAF